MLIIGDMLTLAREYRALSQEELARRIGLSQAQIAKIEAGLKPEMDDSLGAKIASALEFPPSFLSQDETLIGFGSSAYFYRKRATIPAPDRKKIHSTVNLLRIAIKRILPHVEIAPKRPLPSWSIDDYGFSAANVARALRAHWLVPDGPIKNLTALVESAGVLVVCCSFGHKTIDATSLRLADMPPLIFMNSDVPGDRWRFTLAHELAHLIMHREPHDEMETEADAFAGEFLVPKDEFSPQVSRLPRLQIRDLIPMKRYWKVSIQALIFRAYEAGAITEAQKRNLFVRMSQLNMRQTEPEPIDLEVPSNLSRMFTTLMEVLHFTFKEVSDLLAWNDREARELLPLKGPTPPRLLRVV
jgi:Zn-dependent peptidase ImmA (M78 family)/DNA-binding XRE family transcriptional regulator